jgi:hypothetical protein
VIVAFAIVLIASLTATAQDDKSLSGSYVVFDSSAGGVGNYTPDQSDTFCFRAETFTADWEYVYNLWLLFPSDWVVTDVVLDDTPAAACDNGSWGTFSWAFETSPYEVNITHTRNQATTDHCIAYYCVTATPPVGASGPASISWYYDGDGYGATPHWPCSNDGYTPPGQTTCDEAIELPASIPIPVELQSFSIE